MRAKILPENFGGEVGLDGGRRPPYSGDDGGNNMEARLVKLETLADITKTTLSDIKGDVREIRQDTKELRKEISSAKVWALLLMGTMWASLIGIMAKGFGWLK